MIFIQTNPISAEILLSVSIVYTKKISYYPHHITISYGSAKDGFHPALRNRVYNRFKNVNDMWKMCREGSTLSPKQWSTGQVDTYSQYINYDSWSVNKINSRNFILYYILIYIYIMYSFTSVPSILKLQQNVENRTNIAHAVIPTVWH